MIKKITVTNHLGDSLTIDLARPELSGLAITQIDGLGPVKATVNINDYATIDGGAYKSAKLPPRNIVLAVRFYDHMKDGVYYTAEDIRTNTYTYFPVKHIVTLTIETDRKVLFTRGYVESNEPDIFSKTSGASISILCPDPNLYGSMDYEDYSFELSTTLAAFEFPFESEPSTYLEFGYVGVDGRYPVYYAGTTDIGALVTLTPMDNITSEFTLSNTTTGETLKIYDPSLKLNDRLIINNEDGNKKVSKLNNGVYTNAINVLKRDSQWVHLTPGWNIFTFNNTAKMAVTVSYRPAYMGV